uniref:RNA-dependent RNA polymerase n=2 Tax=Kalanchoe fedtschenkoi TaxID=63787 RepID=A0A7N0VFB0_KALFE
MVVERATARVSNIPLTATAGDLLAFLETKLGPNTVLAIDILTERKNWKSRGHGRVQFQTLEAKSAARRLSEGKELVFRGLNLALAETYEDIVARPLEERQRLDDGVLHLGFMSKEDVMYGLECWEGVRAWVMPERKRVEFWAAVGGQWFKVEFPFEHVREAAVCKVGDGVEMQNAILLKVTFAPKLYQKVKGPDVTSKSAANRYFICKEDCEVKWIRTTDFSDVKSVGQSTSFCWMMKEGSVDFGVFSCLPCFKERSECLNLEDWRDFHPSSDLVPLVKCELELKQPYEVLFQLNSLVHAQKISLAATEPDLIEMINGLGTNEVLRILQKMHKLKSMCYEPLDFIRAQSRARSIDVKNPRSSSDSKLKQNNLMSCHRALITPTKIYCLGPEQETSNYVVKHYKRYASDFLRVSFVEEDWSKLPPTAISAHVEQEVFSKPFRTRIHDRVLSILRDGVVIGDKRFQFLAFSASQLRSNSIWMFASNDEVTAEEIREWMGCFNKIRSVSKCAARMGQLFSSSLQTVVVPAQDVEIIPDIETVTDGVKYCFSDGIGKISVSFARQVAQKCGLSDTPSAFQIRYGGYKGVIAVDRNSFRKLSLRRSMLKFESKSRMLNVTKWTEPMPCYLNREIVSLLSTLGVDDTVFEDMQKQQLESLNKMLTDRSAAIKILQHMSGVDTLVKMLLQGYEPSLEPYLSMMIQSYHENHLSELRSRCRIFVPRGKILVGCLDETGVLNYGRVYVRLTLSKADRQIESQDRFRYVDDRTAVLTGKVVVTKNPCLHPGDVRVLDAVYEEVLEENGLVDCLVFPQNGKRPHPSECSGGDLDGDQFFISWHDGLIPKQTEEPMDYTARRPRIMDHNVTLEEIQQFFVDYMINDTLGTISTAHLVHADREPDKARSSKCLELADLHSMAVDFAKTGAPAEMPKVLKPREFPDFMERAGKPTYPSQGVLGKLYRATFATASQESLSAVWTEELAAEAYDRDLQVEGFESFLEMAEAHKDLYTEKLSSLMTYYGAHTEDEILTGNFRKRVAHLQRDNRKFFEMKDRVLLAIKNLHKEAREWFHSSCDPPEQHSLASAWYHVTYHPDYFRDEEINFLSFPWIVGDVLLNIKSAKKLKQASV